MSTDLNHAIQLHDLVQKQNLVDYVWINHSANYRRHTRIAKEAISRVGQIQHVSLFFASALSWIFEDPANTGWNQPSANMLGNGFGWGQSSHVLAWVFYVCPQLVPQQVFCTMHQSKNTGADVAHAASIICEPHNVVMSLSGTSLLPGNEHADPPVGKQIRILIFGTKGALFFGGEDSNPSSGCLEFRSVPDGQRQILINDFCFENLDCRGNGPESLESFVDLCCASSGGTTDKEQLPKGACADVTVGLRSVQVLEAMYRSHATQQLEDVRGPLSS